MFCSSWPDSAPYGAEPAWLGSFVPFGTAFADSPLACPESRCNIPSHDLSRCFMEDCNIAGANRVLGIFA